MIESATARRAVGDWAGACAAARVDVDLNLRAVARAHGREFASRIRADLCHLAPDLLRWHMPRIAPDGLLRPGLTTSLARYTGSDVAMHLVVRTAPAWADAGQRISLALWNESQPDEGSRSHPHPRPDRRFRLDLHRHLWDARRSGELRERSGAAQWSAADQTADDDRPDMLPAGRGCGVHRWAAEAATLRDADGSGETAVTVRLGSGYRLLLDLQAMGGTAEPAALRITTVPARGRVFGPVLPDAATWILPDLELLHAGLIAADQLHPLVVSALVPDHPSSEVTRIPDPADGPRLVECRGAKHRIGLVDGVLVPLDHDPAEVRREELLAALGGPPLPCLRAIDAAHRSPECLVDVRARLDHGDTAGAVAAVEHLLGPEVLLRSGSLRDELEIAVRRQVVHGLFRAGLSGLGPLSPARTGRRAARARKPRATSR